MTHRPRPAHRQPKLTVAQQHDNAQSRAQAAKLARLKAVDFLSESEDSTTSAHPTIAHLDDDESDNENPEDGDEEDMDVPRIAQWIDDEEFDREDNVSPSLDSQGTDDDDDDDHSASEAEPSRRLRSLKDDLSTLPLGVLRSAQRSLAQAHALSDSESDSDAPEDDDALPHPAKPAKNTDRSPISKTVIGKRTNKHAPVQVTSKRPVSRRRVVVDDTLPKPRDPRFMHAAGRYDPAKFKQQYDFIPDLHRDELSTLREHVKRAQKLLVNSPAHLRAERDEEVKRLERAVKRAESAVNLDNRERIESKALRSAKQVETEKRKKGKARWWMKQSEKKALLDKARLDAIASAGGRQAAKKAIEKKQKKMSQKEKKMCPFPRSEGTEWSDGKRRRPARSVDGRGGKRRKVA